MEPGAGRGHQDWTVEELICRELGLPPEEVRPEARFEDLGADRFDRLELIDGVGAALDIHIPDAAVMQLETVADLESFVERSRPGR